MSQVKIDGPKTIVFTAQGIAYVLDMLANCPWKIANPLINDIMSQLKAQEGDTRGPELNRSGEAAAGRGDTSPRNRGLSPVEAVPTDHRAEGVGGYSSDNPASAGAGAKGA